MKKTLSVLALISVFAAAIVYFTSNLSRDKASASFSQNTERRGMNTLTIEAPYGYYVIRYGVVLQSSGDGQTAYKVGGKGVAQQPIGLFGKDTWHSNTFPGEGKVVDIPLERHVRIAPDLNLAATAKLPANKDILERCGQYVFVTKDRSQFHKLESIVSKWEIEESTETPD